MSRKADLMGRRFGRLTVIGEAETGSGGNARWVCRCDCGADNTVLACNLKSGSVTSCGCYSEERHSIILRNNGIWPVRLYHIWYYMLSRCNKPSAKDYSRYGGRGITVCDEWKNNFYVFADWAFSNGYADNLSIDRINNDGNYEPSNCRWETVKGQSNNRRSSRLIAYGGKSQTVSQWAEEIGCDCHAIFARLHNGWTPEEAISIPIGGRR